MVGQQTLHRLLETLAAEPLEKRNGIPASLVRVAKPRASIPDAEAVHLLGGVVAAYPRHGVAERRQQVRLTWYPRCSSRSGRSVSLAICISVSEKR